MLEQSQLFWGVVVSMWVGNLFLLVLNLPLIGVWVCLLSIPYQLLYPIVLVFSAVGVLSFSNAVLMCT
jgi:putative tricarboxylic transport membrane protein